MLHLSWNDKTQDELFQTVPTSCLVDDNLDPRLDSWLLPQSVHGENANHDTISLSPTVWQAVYDLSVHL